MASEGEDNKPLCITNVNNDQDTNFINVYKSLEHILNNKHESFTNKVESLIEVWKQVCVYSLSDKIPYVVQLMDWAKLHTLNIVLTGEWKIHKDTYEAKLLHEVELTENVLHNLNNIFSLRCKKLAEVIRDPWGNPILNRLLNSTEPNIGPEEIEFFSMETGYFVSMRLKKLCESQCEDLALNLVAAFMRCYKMAETQQFNLNTTEKQRWFIFDVYVALLFKYKKMPLILSTLKSLDLKDGLDLVKRFNNKRVKISKVWRHCTKIAQLATQVYVTAAIMKPISESGDILSELLEIWFVQYESDTDLDNLMIAVRRIIQAADSAVHLYIFCEAIHKKFGSKMKTFTIELYIRALTTDMNDLERQKNENDSEKVAETTKRLAVGFCRLADVLEEHINVSRECVLTSFSLQPTSERLKKIEECARRCGYEVLDTGQEWKCKLHPPVLPSDELCWICNSCGEYMSQPQLEIPLNTNTALSEALTAEHLGLSPQLCDDLAVILSSPRYQILSWLHQWDNLHRLCVMYLNDPERTKNLVTELKFVDIDYSVFMSMKREPLDESELTGIERGYEHFLENDFFGEDRLSPLSEDSESQDSRPYSLGSDGAGDSINTFLRTSNTKSDPNVLKSLRMFRPNLKRARASHSGETVPQKLFIGDQGVYTTPTVTPGNQYPSVPNNCSLSHTTTSLVTNVGGPVHHVPSSSNYYAPMSAKEALRNYLLSNYGYRNQEFFKNVNNLNTINTNTFLHNYNPDHQNRSVTGSSANTCVEPQTVQNSREFLNHPKRDDTNNYYSKVVQHPQNKIASGSVALMHRNKFLEDKERRKNKQKFKSLQKFHQKSKTLADKLKNESKPDATMKFQTKEQQLNYLEKKRNSLIDSLFRNVDDRNDCRSTSSSSTSTPEPVDRDSITITSLLSSNKDLDAPTPVADNRTSSGHCLTNPNLKTYHKTHLQNKVTKSGNLKTYSPHSSYFHTPSPMKPSTLKSKKSSVESKYETKSNPANLYYKPEDKQEDFDTQGTNFNDVLEKLLKSKIDEMALDIKNTSEFLKENIGLNSSKHSKNEVSRRTYKPSDQFNANSKSDVKKISEVVSNKVIVQSIETPSSYDRVKIPFSVCNPSDNEIVTSSGMLSIQRVEQRNTLENDSSSFLVSELKVEQQTNKNSANDQHEILRKFSPEKQQNNILENKAENKNSKPVNMLKIVDIKKLIDEKPKEEQFFLGDEEQIVTSDIENVEVAHFLGDSKERENITIDYINENIDKTSRNDKKFGETESMHVSVSHKSSLLSRLLSEPTSNGGLNTNIANNVSKEKNDQLKPTVGRKRGRPRKIIQNTKEIATIQGGKEGNGEIATTQIQQTKNVVFEKNEKLIVQNGEGKKRRRQKRSENIVVKKGDVVRKIGRPRKCSKTEDEVNTTSINSVANKGEKTKENNQEFKQDAIMKEPRVILERIDVKNYEKINFNSENGCIEQQKSGSKKEHDMIPLVILNRDEVKMKMNVIKGDAHLGSKDSRVNKTKENAHAKIPIVITERIDVNINNVPEKAVQSTKVLNPCVVLKRIDVDKKRDAKSVLANVPGLNDLELIRPSSVNHIVQVVQVAGGRSTNNNVTNQNTQTSTQVTPHIQRIGQPRVDKPEQTANPESSSSSASSVTSATTSTKPPTSQPSTLINILSQQIIRPGQSNNNNNNCIRSRTSPLINILSQQIIRPPTSVLQTSKSASETASDLQENNTPKVATTEQQTVSQLSSPIRNSTAAIKTVVGSPSSDQNRIVQFICKSSDGKLIPVTSFTSNRVVKVSTSQTVTSTSPDNSSNYDENFTKFVQVASKNKNEMENPETLPKFQQAFGKSVYNNVDSSDTSSSVNSENIITNSDLEKKVQPKNSTSVNIQPIQGGVIYTRQMPVGQTINLIPPGRGQVFRIASSNSEQISLVKDTVIHGKMSALLAAALQGKPKNSDGSDVEIVSADDTSQTGTRVTVTRPTLVQNARIVKPVIHIPSNVIRNSPQPNLSSTTLEQLREFDMVYKQVKERSSTTTSVESVTTPESIESSQRISVTYLNQGQKFTQLSPVVVVSSYCNLQPAASPALSVTSQGSSSPCVTPAPTPTLPKTPSKSSKTKSVKSTTTHTSKASPIPKPQQKPQEDEHTTQRIFDILAEYAEQLRNSPDLNNKPAPRRRSNPPTNPSQNSKRKKNSGSKKTGQCSSTLTSEADLDDPRTVGSEDSSCGVVQISMQEDEQPSMASTTSESNDVPVTSRQQLILTDASHNQTRNLIIADSSVGEALKMPNTAVLVPGNYIMPVSMVKGGQQIAVVSGGSKILATVPARSGPNMLLFQSFLNQTRKSGVPTVKYSTIQPISGISSQSLAGVSAQPPVILPPTSHSLTAVTLGQPITLKKLDESENRELLLTISQTQDNSCTSTETVQQPDSSTNNTTSENSNKTEECAIKTEPSAEEVFTYKKTLISGPIATPVIAQTACIKEEPVTEHSAGAQTIMTLNLNSQETIKGDDVKVEERVQSVLVTACTSNGPMLAHSPPQYRKPSETSCSCTDSTAKEFLRNGGKQNNNEQKHFQGNTVFYQNKTKKVQSGGGQRLDRELHQLCLQRKQAALERELRLQKSLSEECEDLGVDEPSTSDLFPEADLLFDSNHSPSFDQSSQDLIKRSAVVQDGKEENKQSMTLFSDDDNSGSLRTEFLFEPVEYQPSATELEYDRTQQLTNGQRTTSHESGSSGEDNTLLQNCASMSDVTLNSPISPDPYADNTPPSLNKYKYKYSNRKKNDRQKNTETWPAEVSSSEDTTGSTELGKSSSHSPELCTNKRTHSLSCDDELSDGSFKVVRVAISKTDFLKEDESCEELHCEEDADCSLSGRGARRSVKKLCSCCNGSQDAAAAASRKRPSSGPHAPTPHKKAFLTKKR